jgi:hypothetical protein
MNHEKVIFPNVLAVMIHLPQICGARIRAVSAAESPSECVDSLNASNRVINFVLQDWDQRKKSFSHAMIYERFLRNLLWDKLHLRYSAESGQQFYVKYFI